MAGLIGKKLGMTQVYDEKEELVPVTVPGVRGFELAQTEKQTKRQERTIAKHRL